MTMNKLSTTLTKLRAWTKDGNSNDDNSGLKVSTEPAPAYSKPEMKSPEFQRRAARAMGQTPAAWYG